MKKWKSWVIGITVVLVLGGISVGTYLFVKKSMADLEAKKMDKESPVLEVKDVKINEGDLYKVEDFVSSCKDNLSKCTVEFKEKKMEDYKEPGEYEIIVRALDDAENETLKTVKLTIQQDGSPVKENTEENNSVKEQIEKIGEENSSNTEEFKEDKKLPSLENKQPNITMNEEITKEEIVEVRDVYGATCEYLITTFYEGAHEVGSSEALVTCDFTTYNATLEDLAYEAGYQMVTYADYIASVFLKTNEVRKNNGLEELEMDGDLTAIAELRALEIGYSNKYSTIRPTTNQSILDEAEIPYERSGEFILKDISEPTIAVNQMYNNMEMKTKLNDASFTKIGVGFAYVHNHYYWVVYITG